MATNAPRCVWTRRRSPHLVRIEYDTLDRLAIDTRRASAWVLPEHEQEFLAFNAFAMRWAQTFLVLAFALTTLSLIAAILGAIVWVGLAVGALGVLVVVFPFATPETVAFLGARAAIRLARGLGLVTASLGLLVAALGWFGLPG